MIGKLFAIVTLIASGVLLLILEAIADIPKEHENAKSIGAFLLITLFTTSWGKINNPDFEFKTFLRMIFLMPRRLQWSIRISFSYLIRIKIDNHYMLIRSGKKKEENLKDKFQPVGGVYKMLNPRIICKEFFLVDDNMEDSPSDDLRKRLKKPFHIFGLLRWFHNKEGIEAAPFREFYEELIKTSIISADDFSAALFNKVDMKKTQIEWSKWNKINEYKIFEIYDAHLTPQQEEILRELKEVGHKDIKFLKRDDIVQYSGKDTPWGFGVTDHSLHILEWI